MSEVEFGFISGGDVYHILSPTETFGKALCGKWMDATSSADSLVPEAICQRCRWNAHSLGLPYGEPRPQPKKTRRPRDAQRARLYRAEREAFGEDGPGDLDGSIAVAQAFVDKVQQSSWFRRVVETRPGMAWHGWGCERTRLIVARDYRGRVMSRAGGRYVRYRGRLHPALHITPNHMAHRWVLLHEICHWLAVEHSRHNADFARLYLSAVQRFLGKDAAARLRDGYRKHRVRYRIRRSQPSVAPLDRKEAARG